MDILPRNFNKIQQHIDNCYHQFSSIEKPCEGSAGKCMGHRKYRNEIESMPHIMVFESMNFDYTDSRIKCMDDIEKKLIFQGKEYRLVQVCLYGSYHFRGVTVIDGRNVLYDGMGAFGKGKRKVKFIPGKRKLFK